MQGRNSHYFVNKRQRATNAQLHTEQMQQKYSDEIEKAVFGSHIFNRPSENSFKRKELVPEDGCITNIEVVDMDSVSAIFKYGNWPEMNPIVLNFASYTNPGGMFIQGSSAQEESLCHSSYLYNILSANRFVRLYEWNRRNKNRGLYINRAIYTHDVRFFSDDGNSTKCSVITCAAPNWSVAMKYNNFTKDENLDTLISRIDMILHIAADAYGENLILGAYGCGVFAQDPTDVAAAFKYFLDGKYKNIFKQVIFCHSTQ